MLESRGGLYLSLEPLGADTLGELGMDDLYGHSPVVLLVVGEIHARHAASAKLIFEGIPIGELVVEYLVRVTRHHDAHLLPGRRAAAMGT